MRVVSWGLGKVWDRHGPAASGAQWILVVKAHKVACESFSCLPQKPLMRLVDLAASKHEQEQLEVHSPQLL